jgi:hypothetical protein
MASWLDKMINRVRTADSDEAARVAVRDYLDPATGERVENPDDDSDTHVHIHLEKNGEGGGMARDEFEDPNDPAGNPDAGGTPSLEEMAAQLAALTQRVAQLEGDDEGEMELEGEGPDGTRDVRRYTFRRGAKMKAHDGEDPDMVPERNPEMMGETDLPGIEDLDKRMPTASAADRRRARDRAFRTGDSADMEDSWRDMVALAEIIQPGVRVGTWDARLPVYRQAERMCGLRRRVVDWALKDEMIGPQAVALLNVRTVDGLQCDTVKLAFTSIGNMLRGQNNQMQVRTAAATGARTGDQGGAFKVPTPAEMNKVHREFWKNGAGNGTARR